MLRAGIITICVIALILGFGMTPWQNNPATWDANTHLADVLRALGEEKPSHALVFQDDMVMKGKDLVMKGYTRDKKGKKTARISKYFRCIDCHNTQIEDFDQVNIDDPEARMEFVLKNDLPFLQGTTFYGVVNRETWYNDDYHKKYGDLVKPARQSIRGAIHLCATECSQGRVLEEWEMQAIIAYFWHIGFKLGDLHLTNTDWAKLRQAQDDPMQHSDLIGWLKGFYLQASPAHFIEPWEARKLNANYKGNPERGKDIYNVSCLNCHNPRGVTNFVLDDSRQTFRMLRRHLDKDTRYSIYNAVRRGTYAKFGYKPYMPHFTLEKMSHQQLADLIAFIKREADRKKRPSTKLQSTHF